MQRLIVIAIVLVWGCAEHGMDAGNSDGADPELQLLHGQTRKSDGRIIPIEDFISEHVYSQQKSSSNEPDSTFMHLKGALELLPIEAYNEVIIQSAKRLRLLDGQAELREELREHQRALAIMALALQAGIAYLKGLNAELAIDKEKAVTKEKKYFQLCRRNSVIGVSVGALVTLISLVFNLLQATVQV